MGGIVLESRNRAIVLIRDEIKQKNLKEIEKKVKFPENLKFSHFNFFYFYLYEEE